MNGIRQSLTRKLGPLPVWAWAAVTGGAIFLWRYTHGQYGTGGTTADTVTGEVVSDTGEPQDVTTLDPGQAAYDPNNGQLVSAGPEQFPPFEPEGPVTLDPGESVYDPARGIFGPIKRAAKKAKKKPRKSGVKKKPHHATHGKKTAKPHAGRGKPRANGHVKRDNGRSRGAKPPAKGKTRPTAYPNETAAPRNRAPGRPTAARPSAPGVVKQRTQATHPAPSKQSQAHPKAAPKPQPKPAPKGRRGK